VGAFFTGLAHIASLESDNRRLHDELRSQRILSAQAEEALRENAELRKLAGISGQLGLVGPRATVVGQSLSNFEWSVTIDKGSSQGVEVDQPVVAAEGLVGHVTQVTVNWSKVTLIIDPTSAVAGRLVRSGDTGLVVGNRNKDLIMQMVSPGAQVNPGESVVTAGYQSGLYPGGILIGIVSHVAPAQGALSKIISIQPVVDFSSLQFVRVVTGTRPVSNPSTSPSPGASASPSTKASPSG
jgi:rod shape-determining protein MreC